MEYLMTYGWAILVVMVVGIVMWQLGIFNLGGVTATTSTGFPRIKPQLPLVKVQAGTGTVEATFTNGAGGPLTIEAFNATIGSQQTLCAGAKTGEGSDVGMGSNFKLTIVCGNLIRGNPGDPYDVAFAITYNLTVAGTTIEHVEYGTLRGPLE